MSVTILLIRHAPHEQLGVSLSGRTPGLRLSAAGERQAAALGAWLAGSPEGRAIDRVQAGPLDRTMQTAHAIAAATARPIEPTAALDEIDFGDWTGRSFDQLSSDPAWPIWNTTRRTAAAPNGESMAAAQARIVVHLEATARDRDGGTIAMVSHCDMIRAALAWVLGLSLDRLLRFDIDPASVSTIVLGDWGGRVVRLNQAVSS